VISTGDTVMMNVSGSEGRRTQSERRQNLGGK
jgi:hypothetical protein